MISDIARYINTTIEKLSIEDQLYLKYSIEFNLNPELCRKEFVKDITSYMKV